MNERRLSMTNREELKRLIDQLPDGQTDQALGILVALLRGGPIEGLEIDPETQTWMDADLGGPLPPYDWGPQGAPVGKPVRFEPGVGLVVEGGKDLGG
jgi:hypothetical protein